MRVNKCKGRTVGFQPTDRGVRFSLLAPVLLLLLSGCSTFDSRELVNSTTYHPTENSTLFFVCENRVRKDPDEIRLRCNGDKSAIQYNYKF